MTTRDTQRREVEAQVHTMLGRSAAFRALPQHERTRVLADTTAIVDTMAQNAMAQRVSAPLGRRDPYAIPLIDTPTVPTIPGITSPTTPTSPSPSSGMTGGVQPGAERFGPTKQGDFGTAIATGVSMAGEMLRQVNFPAFVAELIQGVFQAVVDASMQQMRAYAEMVQSVAMSLNDFRDANVTENQARDHLIGKFPDILQLSTTNEGPRVGLRPDVDPDELPDMGAALGLSEPLGSIDDESIESQLVPAARNDLARSRQSLLATLLLMGINRIVVTDGRINAKLKFDFKARDTYQQHAQAYDYKNMGMSTSRVSVVDEGMETGPEYSESSDWSGSTRSGDSKRWTSGVDTYQQTPSIVLTNLTDTVTGGELEASAKLAGDVTLNFKSETFDLNKIASADEVFRLERVRSAGRGAPGVAPPAATPTSPAAPPAAGAAPV